MLKYLEAGLEPEQVLAHRFNGEIVVFQVVMELLVQRGSAWLDKNGEWQVKSRK